MIRRALFKIAMLIVLRTRVGPIVKTVRLLNSSGRKVLEEFQESAIRDWAKSNYLIPHRARDALNGPGNAISALRASEFSTSKLDIIEVTKNAHRREDLTFRETAGTSGSPLKIFYTRTQVARQQAIRAYCWASIGLPYGGREARLWGQRYSGAFANIRNWVLNRKVFNFLQGDIHHNAAALSRYKPDYIYGYSSMVLAAAEYYKEHPDIRPNLKAIVCTAESLQDFQRKAIADIFQCPVVMEYGCTEFDIIALQCSHNRYHVVNPWIVIEQAGDEALFTDISNPEMPFFRYNLGDRIQYTESLEACLCGGSYRTVSVVEGRSIGQLVYLQNGRKCHAVVFAYIAEDINASIVPISQFLVIQHEVGRFSFYMRPLEAVSTQQLDIIRATVSSEFLKLTGDEVEKMSIILDRAVPKASGGKLSYFMSEILA